MGRRPELTFSQRRQTANKHLKSCSTSLIVIEMQIKTIPSRMAIIKNKNKTVSANENVEKLEPLSTAGGNVKWLGHFLKKLFLNYHITCNSTLRYIS